MFIIHTLTWFHNMEASEKTSDQQTLRTRFGAEMVNLCGCPLTNTVVPIHLELTFVLFVKKRHTQLVHLHLNAWAGLLWGPPLRNPFRSRALLGSSLIVVVHALGAFVHLPGPREKESRARRTSPPQGSHPLTPSSLLPVLIHTRGRPQKSLLCPSAERLEGLVLFVAKIPRLKASEQTFPNNISPEKRESKTVVRESEPTASRSSPWRGS